MAISSKVNYHVRNWKAYNEALINRGKITLWLNNESTKSWMAPKVARKKGRPFHYSKSAIETALALRYALNLPLRATEGFLASFLPLVSPSLPVPDYTLLCKRGKEAPKIKKPKRITDIVLDSTGVKVYGEGEWRAKPNGKKERKGWKKLHVGIDPKTGKLVVLEATKSDVHDSLVGCRLVNSIKSAKRVYGDGAYDTASFYKAVKKKGGEGIVPPRKGAVPDLSLPPGDPMESRNNAIMTIAGLGHDEEARKIWKKLKGYHIRSLVESWFSRYKRTLGGVLRSRKESNQSAELIYKATIMNIFTSLGMPVSYAV